MLILMYGCALMTPRDITRYIKGPDYERALVLYENGLFIEAREKAEAVGKNDPDYAAARKLRADIDVLAPQLAKEHAEIGRMYEKAGVWTSAINEYELSLKLNPLNPVAQKRLQALYEASRDAGKAEAMKAAINAEGRPKKQEKETPDALADAHYSQGKAYLDANDYQGAIDEFNSALKLSPGYLDTKVFLARAILEKERAVDNHFKKGIRYFQEEEMEMAVKEWDIVLELDPDNEKAAEYKARAAAIMERLKSIKGRQNSIPAP
ncbi:MAG: tetratricopeptide repeat protein [Deltaproteobacteria bacterium]|nr:tetratricopeptide repeat protein [Deltaproteobacteria bacterium]